MESSQLSSGGGVSGDQLAEQDTPLEVLRQDQFSDADEEPEPKKNKKYTGLRVLVFHSFVPRRSNDRAEKLRIKQLVKKFFKTYSFSRVKTAVNHPNFYQEFCNSTDGVVNVDDKKVLIVQYQRPDGNTSKRYPVFNNHRFWKVFQDEPLKFHLPKLKDVGCPVIVRFKDEELVQYKYCMVGHDTLVFYLNGGLVSEEKPPVTHTYALTDKVARQSAKFPKKDTIYKDYPDTDFRDPKYPQLGKYWLLYLLPETGMLVGVHFYSQNDVTLHVLVAEGVQCFSFDKEHLLAVKKSEPKKKKKFKGKTREHSSEQFSEQFSQDFYQTQILANPTLSVSLREGEKFGARTGQKEFASDISTNNEFTCIKHIVDLKACLAAAIDKETGQNYLVAMDALNTSHSYKILEIQSLQITARTTPVMHIQLISFESKCLFGIAAESLQLHVCYFMAARRFFGVLQFNHPVGSADSEIYGLELLGKQEFIVFGYDILQVFKLNLKFGKEF